MDAFSILFRLSLIFILSGLIGFDRQYNNRPAGIRTHILVGIGSGLVALTQIAINQSAVDQVLVNELLANVVKVDNGRLTAQVISGIGFLGAGTIIVTKGNVKGLTTAASIWATATVSIAIGYGFITLGLFGALFIFLALVVVNKFIRLKHIKKIKIYCSNFSDAQKKVERLFQQEKIKVEKSRYDFGAGIDKEYIGYYTVLIPSNGSLELLVYKLRALSEVVKVDTYE